MMIALVLGILVTGCFGAAPASQDLNAIGVPEAMVLSAPFPELQIEIHFVEGRAPETSSIKFIVDKVMDVTQKTTVTIIGPSLIRSVQPDEYREWNGDAISALHVATTDFPLHVGRWGANGTAYLHMLFLDGIYRGADRSTGVGIQFHNIIGVFPDNYNLAPLHRQIPGDPAVLIREKHTMLHEIGHAFGLVDCGVPAIVPRARANSPCHSTSEESVMNGGTNHIDATSTALGLDSIPLDFDSDDRADLDRFIETRTRAIRISSSTDQGIGVGFHPPVVPRVLR